MEKTYSKKFPSNPELLPEIEKFVVGIVKETNLQQAKITNMELALAEAAANCIFHGNKSDTNKNVTVTVIVNEKEIVIKLKDEGKGFSVEKVPDPTDEENILKGSGRGLHIMKSFVDELIYNFTGTGTETILKIKM